MADAEKTIIEGVRTSDSVYKDPRFVEVSDRVSVAELVWELPYASAAEWARVADRVQVWRVFEPTVGLRVERAHRMLWFTFERLTFSNGVWLFDRDVSQYFVRNEGEITMDVGRDVKFTAMFRLRHNDVINPVGDWIRPVLHFEESRYYSGQKNLGIFYLSFPTREHTPRQTHWDIECKDPTLLLLEAAVTEPYSVDAGSDPIAKAVEVAQSVGLALFNVEPNAWGTNGAAKVLTFPMTWDAGTSKFQVVSELLGSLNYYPPWFDSVGYMTSMRRKPLKQRSATAVYETNRLGLILNEPVEIETDTDRFANQIIVICSNPDLPAPFSVTETNDDPEDPISTVNLGRTISKVLEVSYLIDEEEAVAFAKWQLEEASNIYLGGSLSTRLDLDRAGRVHEVYSLNLYREEGNPLVNGNWWCLGWSMELRPGGIMMHDIGKVQSAVEW